MAATPAATNPMHNANSQRRRRACRKVLASMPPRSTFWVAKLGAIGSATGSGAPLVEATRALPGEYGPPTIAC